MLTRKDLQELAREKLSNHLFVVVSNREPYIHVFKEGETKCLRPASGLVTALDPVVKACSGIWVAHGSGNADKTVVDKKSRVMVPPQTNDKKTPTYTLKRVWMSKEEEDGYYYGFSNKGLWPLCHIAYTRPLFKYSDWLHYVNINKRFASAILEEIEGKNAFIFIQDYHFALLPKFLKEKRPDLNVAQFWHIPWPNPEAFRICPWKNDILEGLLANDILGFHLRYFCDNFLETIDREIEARIDRERLSVFKGGKETLIRCYPISVDFEEISSHVTSEAVKRKTEKFKKEFDFDNKFVLFGLDRIDYTKGILEKLQALDRLLEKYPEYIGKIVLLQKGTLSRIHIQEYKNLNDEIDALVEKLNWKYSNDGWSPVILTKKDLNYEEILALYRLADACVVSSLQDGMNLVSKEFVASRRDEDGILILSQFAGASRELEEGALIINPYDTDNFAETLKKAIEMPKKERRQRMKFLRQVVEENNIYKWISEIISDIVTLENNYI
ncbi:trehalose-6-phosphate synthase [Candidatus Oleimmundimicrobium sp.]|uniref:alpha,alpha-trehalose-phosphate synthase (UDP-forming) n=1 Tax=Candidatus Oleimmundimicrobium sp. TaxID=3060597 RepID=UPI00271C3D40|nr:trehalose-6-phosphate synthase [Candidatus Oleimmundimicrobium sp.]MDO8886543.1 trehalose-6-phosphate synthase [Candidatus Oleimmundimicrobium sp.]